MDRKGDSVWSDLYMGVLYEKRGVLVGSGSSIPWLGVFTSRLGWMNGYYGQWSLQDAMDASGL